MYGKTFSNIRALSNFSNSTVNLEAQECSRSAPRPKSRGPATNSTTRRSAKVLPRLVRVKFRFLELVSAPWGIRFGFQFSFPVRVPPLTKTCARPCPRAAHAGREARARAHASRPPRLPRCRVLWGEPEGRLGRPAEPRRHE